MNNKLFRIEKDSLGTLKIKRSACYGIQTQRAINNFALDKRRVDDSFIRCILQVKKAACLANFQAKKLTINKRDIICKAIEKIEKNNFKQLFPLPPIQGGAGTSINMNINEVIANIGLYMMNKPKGEYQFLSPLDDVNLSQSTNDVLPTALRICIFNQIKKLIDNLKLLIQSIRSKQEKFKNIQKLARTHLQDAVPMTVGEEFGAYTFLLDNNVRLISNILPELLLINLGGTAIGNGINAGNEYRKFVIENLQKITGLNITADKNQIANTQNQSIFMLISGYLKCLASDLSKIASDLRLLSSGPNGGIAELILPPVQAGSTIMPGKVNPVIPELVNQVCFQVIGNDSTILMAATNSQLELGVMLPVLADNLLNSIQLLSQVVLKFKTKCVDDISVNQQKCALNLRFSTANAVFLTSKYGYDKVAEIVKKFPAKIRRKYV